MISDNEHYLAEIDEYTLNGQKYYFGHLDFKRFSKTGFNALLAEWREFRKSVQYPILVYSKDGTPKFNRFITYLGFKPLNRFIALNNGQLRPLYVSLPDAQ